jgi:hypothetical protein
MDNSIDNQEEYCLISSLTQIDICSLIDTKQDFRTAKQQHVIGLISRKIYITFLTYKSIGRHLTKKEKSFIRTLHVR